MKTHVTRGQRVGKEVATDWVGGGPGPKPGSGHWNLPHRPQEPMNSVLELKSDPNTKRPKSTVF